MEGNEKDKKKLTLIGVMTAVVLIALIVGAVLKQHYMDAENVAADNQTAPAQPSNSEPTPAAAQPASPSSAAGTPDSTTTPASASAGDADAAANAAIQAKIDSQPTVSSMRITPVSSLLDEVFGTFQNKDDLTDGARDWTLIAISGVIDLRRSPMDDPPSPGTTVTVGGSGSQKYCGFKLVSADAWPWNEAGQRMMRGENVSNFPAEYNPTLYVHVLLNADSFAQATTVHHGDRVVVVGQYLGASSGGIDVEDGHIVPPEAIDAGIIEFKTPTSVREVSKPWEW